MATFDYASSQQDALDLITEFGGVVAIKRPAGVFDPVTGQNVVTYTNGTLTAVVLNVKTTANSIGQGAADNALVEAMIRGKMRYLLVAAKGATFIPTEEDLVTLPDGEFKVVGNTPLSPAGVPLVYKVGVLKV